MADTPGGIEVEVYRECTLCCGIIDNDDRSLYFWDSGKLVNVCRSCARKLLKREWRIIGITKKSGKQGWKVHHRAGGGICQKFRVKR
jgi:hypothetical protein